MMAAELFIEQCRKADKVILDGTDSYDITITEGSDIEIRFDREDDDQIWECFVDLFTVKHCGGNEWTFLTTLATGGEFFEADLMKFTPVDEVSVSRADLEPVLLACDSLPVLRDEIADVIKRLKERL